MPKLTIATLNIVRNLPVLKIGLLSMLVAIFSGTSMAQCGGSFSALAAAAATVRNQSNLSQSASPPPVQNQSVAANDNAVNTSIVGLWDIRFLVGGELFQEAFQIWNAGGTEVHNPNVDPRQGNVCLGTWTEAAPLTFKLAHRVFLYDTEGHFMAVGHLTETLRLSDRGNTHSGTFTIQAYDLAGNPLGGELSGTVVGERIVAN
jgi:hypothetical protein